VIRGLTRASDTDEVEVTRVASGLRFPVGLAWSHDGYLVIADGLKREIYRLDADQRPSRHIRTRTQPRGFLMTHKGAYTFASGILAGWSGWISTGSSKRWPKLSKARS